MTIAIMIVTCALFLCIPLSNELYRKYSAFILILLSAGYFFYTPPSQDDLYRHYLMLDDIRNYGLNFFDTSNHYWDENPAYVVLLTLISTFQINAFLPFVVGVIYYLSSLYGIYIISFDKKNKSREIIATILLILLTNYINISGIRNMLGCAIFLIGMYLDMIQHRRLGFVLYVFAALIHSSIFIYIIIRGLVFLYRGKQKILVILVAFAIPSVLTSSSDMLANVFSGIPLLEGAVSRFQMYAVDDKGMEISNNWRLVTLFDYIAVFLMAYTYEKVNTFNEKYTDVFHFLVLIIITAIGFFNQRELFSRHTMLLIPIGIMYFVLLKNTTFLRFPFLVRVNPKSFFSAMSPFLCFYFVAWCIVKFLILVFFYYSMADGNFPF